MHGCLIVNNAVQRIEEILVAGGVNTLSLSHHLTVLRYNCPVTDWDQIRLLLVMFEGQYVIPLSVREEWMLLVDHGPEHGSTVEDDLYACR